MEFSLPVRLALWFLLEQQLLHLVPGSRTPSLTGWCVCAEPCPLRIPAIMTAISRSLLTRPHSIASSRARRAAAVGALLAAAVIGSATSASAHVGVFPDSTTAGHEAQLTFRVPDESETASTVKLVVTLPQDRPFTDVSTRPVPGWTATVTEAPLPKPVIVGGATITKAPRTVTWTAQPGNKIAPGEYQEFAFASDALPAAGEMVLPVAQHYSDGTVAQWTEPSVPGQAEPEHPAPAFTVLPASATDASAGATATTQASGKTTPVAATTDNTARVLGGVGLLVAIAAAGLVLLRRHPKADGT